MPKKGKKTMKNMKKIVALLLATVMVMAMSISVFAQTVDVGGGEGSITISNATVGKEYNIYKLFDANPSGTDDLVAYTATEAVYTWLSGNATASNLFTFTKNSAGTYNVEKKEGADDSAIIDFLDSLITKEGETTTVDSNLASLKVGSTVTAEDNSVTFDNIPFGYYVVQSSLGATVSVDTTNKDVTIIDKNQEGPDWDIDEDGTGKALTDEDGEILTTEEGTTVTENSANYGDIVYYAIGVNSTNFDGADQIINYFITDKLAEGFDYDKESLEVRVGDAVLEEDAYDITWNDDNSFEITIPWVDADSNSLYASPNTIKVTYSATVTDEAAIAGDGNKNTANFTYQKKNGEKIPYDEENEKETTTYVYALGLKKVATKTGSEEILLAGATFAVADADGQPVYVVAGDAEGEYKLDTSEEGGSNEVVTPESGVIIIKGLKEGTYTLTETEAPAGYNLLNAPVSITASIAETTNYKQTIITHYDADGHVVATEEDADSSVTTETSVNVVPVSVENQKGTELPSTGGIGTTMFYIVGSVLVIGAAVVLISKRRMAR